MPEEINQLKLGMQLGKFPQEMSPNDYSLMLNGNIQSKDGSVIRVVNEPSNLLCSRFKTDFRVVGTIPINVENKVIYFLVNPITNKSEIGEISNVYFTDSEDKSVNCKNCNGATIEDAPLETIEQKELCIYKTIISASCLNFNINFPIEGTYKITTNGITIYFAQDGQPLRYLELFDIPYQTIGQTFDDCKQDIYNYSLDCSKIKIFRDVSPACILATDLSTGGSLQAGVYQFGIVYVADRLSPLNNYQPLTDYSNISNPVSIFQRFVTIQTDYPTSKSIKLEISNLNTTFDYFNLVVIKTVDNISTPYLIGTFPVNSNSFSYTYTGNNNSKEIQLSIDEILRRKPVYSSATSVTQANDFLFWSKLKEQRPINLQPIVSRIQSLRWATIEATEDFYANGTNSNYKSYLRDEEYTFGIEFQLSNGFTTATFPFVGRVADANDLINIPSSDPNYIVDTNCQPSQREFKWQFYNTATNEGKSPCYSDIEITDNCNFQNFETGKFSYTESTASYPNNPEVWAEFCGKKIRHFKFPDFCVSPFIDGSDSNSNKIYPIGIVLDVQEIKFQLNQAVAQGLITEEEKLQIVGYRIKRGNRVGNKSIIAKGLIYDVLQSKVYAPNLDGGSSVILKDTGQTILYPNYGFNDLGILDPYLDTGYVPESRITGKYTFFSPDTLFNNPSLPTESKIESSFYGKAIGRFNEVEQHAKYALPKQSVYDIAIALATAELAAEITLASIELAREISIQTIDNNYNFAKDLFNITAISGYVFAGVVASTNIPGLTVAIPGITAANLARNLALTPINVAYVAAFALNQALTVYQRFNTYVSNWVDIIVKFETPKNPAIYYTGIGKYTNYCCPAPNKQFQQSLNNSRYLEPGNLSFSENSSTVLFNNYKRESSVYLSFDIPFQKTQTLTGCAIEDDSKILFSGDCNDTGCTLNVDKCERLISSHYMSIKNYVPDQYGTIDQIEWIDAGYCGIIDWENTQNTLCDVIFGGDTFLSRFALKRKFPFFVQDRVGFNTQDDIEYRYLSNVGKTEYYFNSLSYNDSGAGIGTGGADFKAPVANLECDGSSYFFHRGKLVLYNYSIPYFIVESDYNTNFRHAEDELVKNFYPNIQDVPYWTQEWRNPIYNNNTYFYNNTYSKQNKENPYYILKNNYNQLEEDRRVELVNRVIYSQQQNYFNYFANDYFDFHLNDGKLVNIKGIEQQAVLVTQENTTSIFNAFITVQTSLAALQVTAGTIFSQKPREFYKTDLGFGGATHKQIISTPYGHFWIDVSNPSIMRYSSDSLLDITKDSKDKKVKWWFRENLPFQIIRDFPLVNIDNSYNNIGITMGWDNKYERVFITKQDWKLKSKYKNLVSFNNGVFTYIKDEYPLIIEVTNSEFFESKCWTIAYSPIVDQFISFYSFFPNYYISNETYFQTGYNDGLYSHLLTNKSFQVFQGKLFPFFIEYTTKGKLENQQLNAISFQTEFRRYTDDLNYYVNQKNTFNKALIYTENQTSGHLKLIPKEKNNLYQQIQYPKISTEDGLVYTEILVDNVENNWYFNQFQDRVNDVNIQKNNSLQTNFNTHPILNYNNPMYKELNPSSLNYTPYPIRRTINNEYFQVRLINDIYSNYNIISVFNLTDTQNY